MLTSRISTGKKSLFIDCSIIKIPYDNLHVALRVSKEKEKNKPVNLLSGERKFDSKRGWVRTDIIWKWPNGALRTGQIQSSPISGKGEHQSFIRGGPHPEVQTLTIVPFLTEKVPLSLCDTIHRKRLSFRIARFSDGPGSFSLTSQRSSEGVRVRDSDRLRIRLSFV